VKRLILKDFVLEEISGVDRPAQVGAKMSIIKREREEETDMSAEDLKELQKKVAELTDALVVSKSLASLNDAEKSYLNSLPEGSKDSFLEKSADERQVQMDLAKSNDEVLEIDGATISKGAIGADFFAVIKSQQSQLKKQEAETKKAREAAMQAGFVKRATDSYSHLPGTAEEIGTLLRETADLSKGAQDTLSTVLTALEKMNASSFVASGHGGGKDEGATSLERLDTLAKAHAEKHNVDYATAYSEVIEKNADLYADSIN
jgi:hypothetical protein